MLCRRRSIVFHIFFWRETKRATQRQEDGGGCVFVILIHVVSREASNNKKHTNTKKKKRAKLWVIILLFFRFSSKRNCNAETCPQTSPWSFPRTLYFARCLEARSAVARTVQYIFSFYKKSLTTSYNSRRERTCTRYRARLYIFAYFAPKTCSRPNEDILL